MSYQLSIVGPGTRLTGRVVSEGELIVAGAVEGDVFGAKVTIKNGGRVAGNVHTDSLVIEAGGIFDGLAHMSGWQVDDTDYEIEAELPDPFKIEGPDGPTDAPDPDRD